MGLSQALLKEHKNKIQELIILPSSGGVFEIRFKDELIFSKKQLDRFPEEGEIEKIVRERIK